MTTQVRNNEMVNLLRADFQARYEPNFAAVNAIPAYTLMSGVRGFWPFSSVDSSVNLIDLSGQARNCTNNNTPTFNVYGLMPYATFNGSNQKFTRADEAGLDILGNEAYPVATKKGLTVCAWMRINSFGAGYSGIVTKYNTTPAQSTFFLGTNSGGPNTIEWIINSGSNYYFPTAITGTTTRWYFVCGRFSPSADVSLFVNGTWSSTAVAPATVNNSAAALEIGAAPGLNYFNGDITLVALYANYLSNTQVSFLYDQTRAGFGM